MAGNEVVEQFLAERPDMRAHTREDPQHGLVGDDAWVEAFVAWALAKGLTTPERVEGLRRQMDAARRAARYEEN